MAGAGGRRVEAHHIAVQHISQSWPSARPDRVARLAQHQRRDEPRRAPVLLLLRSAGEHGAHLHAQLRPAPCRHPKPRALHAPATGERTAVNRFRAGRFARDEMPEMLRRFSPSESLATVEEVDLAALQESGKKLVLLDVDNTLMPWRSNEIPETVHEWLAEGKSLGLEFCILSNTRHPARLIGLSERLGVPFIRSKFKPSRRMYLMALERHGCKAEEAVMVGDQLLTDVLGANRSGIDAIWIRPVGKREFIGTRLVSRNIESLVGRFLFKYFQVAGGELEKPGPTGLFSHKIVRQFLKFCVVGGLSTVIDLGLHNLLMFWVPMGDSTLMRTVGEWAWSITQSGVGTDKNIFDAAFAPLKIPTVVLAILNSYYWNRRWTFKVDKKVGHGSMITKFFVIALIGLVLNVGISSSVNRMLDLDTQVGWAASSLVALVVVVFWNFFGQKLWTFGKHSL
ncbi:MAG: YqeG family HAD IIIA-type phosphatase [Armatimonadetes bacterium]|nr:YqeG family HAD IIIA-type phosphatase [Armatimonadota bacterium]